MRWSRPDKQQVLSWLAERWPLLLVVALSLVTRMPLVLAKLGGFHAYNEGFYALGAVTQSQGSVLETLLNPVDLNNMPVFSWILTGIVATVGRAEWAIRLPSLVSSLAAVFMAGVLAERLVHPKAAVYAAAFVAVAPAFVLVGTNAQPDMLMVSLALGGILAYVEAYRAARAAAPADPTEADEERAESEKGQPRSGGASGGETRLRILSGVLFGISILAKLNGVLAPVAVAAWETTRRRGVSWALRPSARLWLATWIGLPAAWVVLQTILRGSELLSSQEGLARTFLVPDADFFARSPGEFFFQVGPALAVVGVVGLVMAITGRQRGQTLLLWIIGVNVLFFAFYHFHSYYLIMGVVAFAMLAALPVASIRTRWTRWLVFALLMAIAIPFTWMSYQMKMSAPGIAVAAEWINAREPGEKTVVLPKLAADNSGQVFQFYMPEATLERQWPGVPGEESTPTFVVFYHADKDLLPAGSWLDAFQDTRFPVLFGRAIAFQGASIHWFAKERLGWVPVGPIWWFGEYPQSGPDLSVVEIGKLSKDQARAFYDDWHDEEIISPK